MLMSDPCSWGTLNEQEWSEYIHLVDAFALAKREKRYADADALRRELQEWQEVPSDQDFLDMSQTGVYRWLPVFEKSGSNGHRARRINKRLSESPCPNPE